MLRFLVKMLLTDSQMSIEWIDGDDKAENHPNLDVFILETFYSFILHKKMVYLDLWGLHKIRDNEIVRMVMKPKSTLIKEYIFELFPHVEHIRIDADDQSARFLRALLKLLRKSNLPETLTLITIQGQWLDKAFTDKMKSKYESANISAELDRYGLGGKHALHLNLKKMDFTATTRQSNGSGDVVLRGRSPENEIEAQYHNTRPMQSSKEDTHENEINLNGYVPELSL